MNLFSPCFFRSHDFPVHERDEEGKAILICPRCRTRLGELLNAEVPVRGPLAEQRRDKGAVLTKAKIVRTGNVIDFEQSQR